MNNWELDHIRRKYHTSKLGKNRKQDLEHEQKTPMKTAAEGGIGQLFI